MIHDPEAIAAAENTVIAAGKLIMVNKKKRKIDEDKEEAEN